MSNSDVCTTSSQTASRLNNSVSIWLLAFAACFMLVVLTIPGKALNAADGVTSTFRVLVTKLASFLPSNEQPQIVVLGSSLVLTPAVRCDDKLEGKAPCYERWYYDRYIPEYTRSTYFQQQLKEKAALNVEIKNLGVASSIMSDQYAIFKLLLAEKKHPQLLILGLAPRDFLDNSQQRHLETPTRMFVKEYEEAPLSLSGAKHGFAPDELKDLSTRVQHRIDKVFGRIRSGCTELACKLSGHNSRVELNSSPAYVGDRPNRLKDIETYRKLYNPPNIKMLEQQSEYLKKLLVEAKQNKIDVLVINMPLTKENIASLDSRANEAYVAMLERTTRENGGQFLNIGSTNPEYSLSDFEDCCHLNSRGGETFYRQLISFMSNKPEIVARLSAPRDNVQIAKQTSKTPL